MKNMEIENSFSPTFITSFEKSNTMNLWRFFQFNSILCLCNNNKTHSFFLNVFHNFMEIIIYI